MDDFKPLHPMPTNVKHPRVRHLLRYLWTAAVNGVGNGLIAFGIAFGAGAGLFLAAKLILL